MESIGDASGSLDTYKQQVRVRLLACCSAVFLDAELGTLLVPGIDAH